MPILAVEYMLGLTNDCAMKGIFLIIILFLLSACSSKPNVVKHVENREEAGEKIYVVNHGWHTGFVVPSEKIQDYLPKLRAKFEDAPYIEFGWGDKGFYQAKEITTGLTLRAIFWPTESVIHAVAVPKNIRGYFQNSQIETICLSSSEYNSLINFISNSFYKNEDSEILELRNGIYGDSQFYKGVGDYYLMNTCNKWTAKGLKSAGLDISPTFKLTAGSVMNYIVAHNQALTITSSGQATAPASLCDCLPLM